MRSLPLALPAHVLGQLSPAISALFNGCFRMRIKNWNKFQHFKDRRPPWIKLHREILEQRDISAISDCSFRVLVGLWLLASEDEAMEGNLPSIEDISFRLRMPESSIINSLSELESFVEQDDITLISGRYQRDPLEKEVELEVKEERETEAKKSSKRSSNKIIYESWPELPSKPLFDDWMEVRKAKKAKNTQTAIDGIGRELHKAVDAGHTVDDCVRMAVERSWSGFTFSWMENANSPPNKPGFKNHAKPNDDFAKKDYTTGATDGCFGPGGFLGPDSEGEQGGSGRA